MFYMRTIGHFTIFLSVMLYDITIQCIETSRSSVRDSREMWMWSFQWEYVHGFTLFHGRGYQDWFLHIVH